MVVLMPLMLVMVLLMPMLLVLLPLLLLRMAMLVMHIMLRPMVLFKPHLQQNAAELELIVMPELMVVLMLHGLVSAVAQARAGPLNSLPGRPAD